MLMDLFFESAGVSKKERVHFNSFMLDVHDSEQLLYSTGYNNYRYTDASQLSIHRPTFIHIYVLSASLVCTIAYGTPPPPSLAAAEIHWLKLELPPRVSGGEKPEPFDPIAPVARDIAASSHLLCFDEFQASILIM